MPCKKISGGKQLIDNQTGMQYLDTSKEYLLWNKDKSCKHFRDITKLIDTIDVTKTNFPEQIQDEIVRFERMCWEIYSRMSESHIKLSIYPLKFEAIDEETTRMYLQNMILYAKPNIRYYLVSLLLKNLTKSKVFIAG